MNKNLIEFRPGKRKRGEKKIEIGFNFKTGKPVFAYASELKMVPYINGKRAIVERVE